MDERKKATPGAFDSILEGREKKTKRINLLLTESNFDKLTELSEKTGNSKNEIVNRLIAECYANVDL